MKQSEPLEIQQVIIHKVDHIRYAEPQLSDLPAPLSAEIDSFLRRQILINRDHKHTRNALFTGAPPGEPSTQSLCEGVFDQNHFVDCSQELACHLFSTLDKRTSPGDLVVCRYASDGVDWLALLKMTPKDGVVGERKEVGGQVQYVFRPVDEVLPTGELQKCAFIVSSNDRQRIGYDLRVLDQQAAGQGVQRLVASFFIADFLQCRVNLNRSDKTRNFIIGSNEWLLEKENSWLPYDIERFRNRVLEVVQNNVVDLDDFAQEVIEDPAEQDEYLQYMQEKQGMDELTFRPDPAERERRSKYTILTGDHGLRIRIETDAYKSSDTFQVSDPDNAGVKTITIRTRELRIEQGKSR